MSSPTIHISTSNSKLGRIPNISLPPQFSCPPGIPCATDTCCYAMKAWRQYPVVRKAWGENLQLYQSNPVLYFWYILRWIHDHHRTTHFRWHVAGDIPDAQYLHLLRDLCDRTGSVSHLIYTKRYAFDYSNLPPNLSVITSAWPGVSTVRVGQLPVAWCQDGEEERIPHNAIECRGGAGKGQRTCDHCLLCWNLSKGKEVRDVWFRKH